MSATSTALELARETGFDLAGVAPHRAPRDAGRFRDWIAAGRHAGMGWLARDADKIADPTTWIPSGRSLLIVGLAHSRAAFELPGGGRVARYAAGRDYHNVLARKLRRLRGRLASEGLIGPTDGARAAVDAAPLMERSHAAEAGIGFASKAANLLHPTFGPWFFLGELVLDVGLEPTGAPPTGSCGTCRACIDACPTQAIVEPGAVDAGRCISYHTIENRGPSPRELRESFGAWAFGCDVCSEVCPWGAKAPDRSADWGEHPALAEHGLVRWLTLEGEEQVSREFQGSPLQRPRRAGLARNAAIALGNLPGHRAEAPLLHALSFDADALVREAAAWALARTRGDDASIRAELERAAERESEPKARAEMRRTLDELA